VKTIFAIARYTFKQHVRHRIYLTVALFGLILLAGSLVISSLAVEEQARMLLDLGLAGIEFVALLAIVFVTVNLVLEEIDSRAITLILVHPVKRSEYLLGRFFGTLFAIVLGMIGMAALHLVLLFPTQWTPGWFYALAWVCSLGKVAIIGALALLLSLFSTSTASAMTFTIFFWILGHFTGELQFLSEKSNHSTVKVLVWAMQKITPNFSYYNYRDFWAAVSTPPASWYFWLVAYTFAYVGVCLFLSNFLFSQKEF